MFARIRKWFREQRAWHAAHKTAWALVTRLEADELTPFQHECTEALLKAIPGLKFDKNKGEKESYLVADLPSANAKVYVYLNGSNIHEKGKDFIAEEWDFKTPQELIKAVVNEARKRVAI